MCQTDILERLSFKRGDHGRQHQDKGTAATGIAYNEKVTPLNQEQCRSHKS